MNTILLIIDGIGLPFPVIDHVIQRAKSGGNDVIGLFIKSAEEPPVGYVFPVISGHPILGPKTTKPYLKM